MSGKWHDPAKENAGDGQGGFSWPIRLGRTANGVEAAAVSDFNGDGRDDIAFVSPDPAGVTVYRSVDVWRTLGEIATDLHKRTPLATKAGAYWAEQAVDMLFLAEETDACWNTAFDVVVSNEGLGCLRQL